MLEELVKRAPKAELIGEVSRLRSNFVNGLKHMRVRLTPGVRSNAWLMFGRAPRARGRNSPERAAALEAASATNRGKLAATESKTNL